MDKTDYINYITSFDQLYDIPRDKKGGEYRIYLSRWQLIVVKCLLMSCIAQFV